MRTNFLYEYIIAQIDFGTLAVLFCLMAVVAGFHKLGYFDKAAGMLVQRAGNLRLLMMVLVMAAFFVSMLVTNDVGLIIMVPFTIQTLHTIGRNDKLIKVAVLETIAANLGSMLTPIGNPQNVYLYQYYKMKPYEFFCAISPFALVSALLLLLILFMDKDGKTSVEIGKLPVKAGEIGKCKKTILYLLLFFICLLAVMDIIPYLMMLVLVGVGIAAGDYRLFRKVNYSLLGKFVILFVLVGNVAKIPLIRENLYTLVSGNEFLMGIGLSQILSNVPTAVMLSKFTENGLKLLLGVNIGGLGTLIASMASMITLEYYGKAQAAKKRRYIAVFTGYNLLFLLLLCGLYLVIK